MTDIIKTGNSMLLWHERDSFEDLGALAGGVGDSSEVPQTETELLTDAMVPLSTQPARTGRQAWTCHSPSASL